MVTLQETAVKFNNNLHVSHTGGRLSSDSGLLLVDEDLETLGEKFIIPEHFKNEELTDLEPITVREIDGI